mmetsp:Transcript_80892/g.210783  ORF Transcript_80892/g.210783 Transcript_80892/m.210783 type:complete len:529 (-) Transcript_80892:106-1692(-)
MAPTLPAALARSPALAAAMPAPLRAPALLPQPPLARGRAIGFARGLRCCGWAAGAVPTGSPTASRSAALAAVLAALSLAGVRAGGFGRAARRAAASRSAARRQRRMGGLTALRAGAGDDEEPYSPQPDVERGALAASVDGGAVVGRSKSRAAFVEQPAPLARADEEDKYVSAASRARVLILVAGHATCAASLLVVNKWALKRFPYVWTLATVQFVFAASVTFVAGKLGIIEVDALDMGKLIKFFPAAGMFFVTITAGNAVVGVSNVDTFIVMRSVVPIPSAIVEALVLGEPCPAPRSWLGLATILLGAIGYCSTNQGLLVDSVAWVVLYLVLMPLDGVLIKHLVGSSGLSPWGLVLYNNLCAALPGLFFSAILEHDILFEPGKAQSFLTFDVLFPCILSCFAGLAISYFQLNVRKAISSTAFMVLGVSNKFLSVLINQVASLDANKDIMSLGSVLVSIAGAIVFQQTVTGKGISQARPSGEATGGGALGFVVVIIALGAAALITATQGQVQVRTTSTIAPDFQELPPP